MDAQTESKFVWCARAAHEANRNYCYAIGDDSQPPWEEAPAWQRESAIAGVQAALDGATPEQSHQSWMKLKLDDGWTYGEQKDPDAKKHPCLVPYEQLPESQRAKDDIYLATVRAAGRAIGLKVTELAAEPARTARQLYERYCDASGGLNFRGEPCPSWETLPEKIQENWQAVADYMAKAP